MSRHGGTRYAASHLSVTRRQQRETIIDEYAGKVKVGVARGWLVALFGPERSSANSSVTHSSLIHRRLIAADSDTYLLSVDSCANHIARTTIFGWAYVIEVKVSTAGQGELPMYIDTTWTMRTTEAATVMNNSGRRINH